MTETPAWLIRPLRQSDLPAFRPVRLAALRDHPEAFGSSYEDERDGGPGNEISRLIARPPGVTLGGFAGARLVGTISLSVSPRAKQRHKGHLTAVYVAPDWRGRGLARALLDASIAHARAVGLSALTLTVTVGNNTALALYQRAGFRSYGVEPRGIRVGPDLLDETLMVLLLD